MYCTQYLVTYLEAHGYFTDVNFRFMNNFVWLIFDFGIFCHHSSDPREFNRAVIALLQNFETEINKQNEIICICKTKKCGHWLAIDDFVKKFTWALGKISRPIQNRYLPTFCFPQLNVTSCCKEWRPKKTWFEMKFLNALILIVYCFLSGS